MHRMMRDAFREVHARHLRRLDQGWDLTFKRLERVQTIQERRADVQERGGDNVPKPLKEFSYGSVRGHLRSPW